MGQSLTYEIGKVNIGRRVRVKSKDGGQGMGFGTLTGAMPTHADVKPDNYSGPPIKHAWSNVRDWTSRNSGPLIMPPVLAVKTTPAPAGPTPMPIAADPFAIFGALSTKIPEAVSAIDDAEEEVDAATEMMQQAKANHADAVARLASLRKEIGNAAAMVDQHLTGTSEAKRP